MSLHPIPPEKQSYPLFSEQLHQIAVVFNAAVKEFFKSFHRATEIQSLRRVQRATTNLERREDLSRHLYVLRVAQERRKGLAYVRALGNQARRDLGLLPEYDPKNNKESEKKPATPVNPGCSPASP